MCITESFCYLAEIKHSIVNQLYFEKKNLKEKVRLPGRKQIRTFQLNPAEVQESQKVGHD